MSVHEAAVREVVDRFQIGLVNTPSAGASGELLGRSSGSSLEFQEHRDYHFGDDIRHLDWTAYARTDALMVRMYRDEISPRTQILLDVSASMNSGEGHKATLARQAAMALAQMVRAMGGEPTVTLIDDSAALPQLSGEQLESLSKITFDAVRPLDETVKAGKVFLKPQSARILISDFLFPHDPATLLRRLHQDASLFWVVQILNRFESDPQPIGGRRLVEDETRQHADLLVGPASIQRYRQRLARLQQQLQTETRRHGGRFVTVIAEDGLPAICAGPLCQHGILRPR